MQLLQLPLAVYQRQTALYFSPCSILQVTTASSNWTRSEILSLYQEVKAQFSSPPLFHLGMSELVR